MRLVYVSGCPEEVIIVFFRATLNEDAVSFILQIQSVFPSSVSDDVPAQGSSLVWIIVAIAAVVVIGGAIVLIAVLKKKKV